MTERARSPRDRKRRRKRAVDASVAAVSALALVGGLFVAAEVDRGRTEVVTVVEGVAPDVARAPLPGLVPAPRPGRRVVVVRRSRPS